jgi:hypothetical protein
VRVQARVASAAAGNAGDIAGTDLRLDIFAVAKSARVPIVFAGVADPVAAGYVDHCCYAWNTLIGQPWKIMSIARRDWAAVGHSI